jgi:hypothetical protein
LQRFRQGTSCLFWPKQRLRRLLLKDPDQLTQAFCPAVSGAQATGSNAERRRGEGLSNKEILPCLKRFIAREVFHLLMGRPPLQTAAT